MSFERRRWIIRLTVLLLLCPLAPGCVQYKPPPRGEWAFLERAETKTDGEVTVKAVVLAKGESREVFGVLLDKHEIQPVWVEVDNTTSEELILLLLRLDPNYFSPSEAAWKSKQFGETGMRAKKKFFYEQHLPIVIPPATTASGFVYANRDPGAKAFAVALAGDRTLRSFDFFQLVPGLEADFMTVDFESLYAPEEIQDLDLEGLRAYVEELPCCTIGGDRETPGDPLNLVIVGSGEHVLATLVRRRWDLSETVTAGTAWRTVLSSVFKARYRTSPISPLYLFDRPHDAALQKSRSNVDERNHLRLWRAPVTLEGEMVWVGQISRDIGVRLSSVTLVTHQIDPMVDEARAYLAFDLIESQSLGTIGYATGVGEATYEAPRFNFTKDPYYTDGLRAVLILSEQQVPLDEIRLLDWELPTTRLTDDGRPNS